MRVLVPRDARWLPSARARAHSARRVRVFAVDRFESDADWFDFIHIDPAQRAIHAFGYVASAPFWVMIFVEWSWLSVVYGALAVFFFHGMGVISHAFYDGSAARSDPRKWHITLLSVMRLNRLTLTGRYDAWLRGFVRKYPFVAEAHDLVEIERGQVQAHMWGRLPGSGPRSPGISRPVGPGPTEVPGSVGQRGRKDPHLAPLGPARGEGGEALRKRDAAEQLHLLHRVEPSPPSADMIDGEAAGRIGEEPRLLLGPGTAREHSGRVEDDDVVLRPGHRVLALGVYPDRLDVMDIDTVGRGSMRMTEPLLGLHIRPDELSVPQREQEPERPRRTRARVDPDEAEALIGGG